jgi:hypothetical protein
MNKDRKGIRIGQPVKKESDQFMKCEACDEYFDMRELGDIGYHMREIHKPPSKD